MYLYIGIAIVVVIIVVIVIFALVYPGKDINTSEYDDTISRSKAARARARALSDEYKALRNV